VEASVVSDQPRRILLVEDDRFLRKAVETTLKQQGYTVITAADGEEALRVARSAPLDLILLDLIMPNLNGCQVLDALKRDPPTAHIPVIILSNVGQDRDVQQAMEAGATAYFIKADLSLQALVQRVGEALAAGGA
jgi:CheY-like chemotaxis protein